MRLLSATDLLAVWEQGQTQSPVQQALLLLVAACPETPPEVLTQLSIGQRDGLLLRLREETFGPQLVSQTTCPNCGDRLELNFQVADIRVEPAAPPSEELSLQVENYAMTFHLPTSQDLEAIAHHQNPLQGQQALLERCLTAINYKGQAQSWNQLPETVIKAVAATMAEADPQADILLALTCPTCQHQWQVIFDIVSFFWSEINHWAQCLLYDIHRLATAYGWPEADILAMSAQRRQYYLEMVGV